jgi:uncharacterized protein (TIGR02596 family)
MLVVVAIVVSLFAIAATGAKKSWQMQELKGSVTRLTQDLALASLTAVKLNQTVIVRFYKYQSLDTASQNPEFHAWQLMRVLPPSGKQTQRSFVPLYELQKLERGGVFSGNIRFSNALHPVIRYDEKVDPRMPIPKYDHVDIEFRPSGRTNLDPAKAPHCITIIPVIAADTPDKLPLNFFTLSIDANSGSVRQW